MQNLLENNWEENILLFDGECDLCNGVVKFVIKRDNKNKFKFASLQSAIGRTLLGKFHLETDHYNSFVLVKGKSYFIKSAAVFHMLKDLGGVWKLFFVFMLSPKLLRDAIYNIIAKNRFRIFKGKKTCIVQTDNIKNKFIN